MHSYQFDWTDDGFEFAAKMPEELLVKAMNSTRPIFLTDDFMGKLAAVTAEQVVKDMITDLHRDTDADDTGDVLRWHYLFMDFERDFPRLMAMQRPADVEPEG
ncbi:MAG: hypothetical protein M3R04_05250 [bacterium]|nr:hypothetical protein [bacterium]